MELAIYLSLSCLYHGIPYAARYGMVVLVLCTWKEVGKTEQREAKNSKGQSLINELNGTQGS
jgi:hypothetical protein